MQATTAALREYQRQLLENRSQARDNTQALLNDSRHSYARMQESLRQLQAARREYHIAMLRVSNI